MSFLDNFKLTRSFKAFPFQKKRVFEHHENVPTYNREPLSIQIDNFLTSCDGMLGKLRPFQELDLK
jgi:hypothetical protein